MIRWMRSRRQRMGIGPWNRGKGRATTSDCSRGVFKSLLSEDGIGTIRLNFQILNRRSRMRKEARLTHLAYSPEIASVMLRRQQAEAIISARQKIVHGAVSMVQMALSELSEKEVVVLDEKQKASMVGNLLVVLCGDAQAEPVINAGSATK